MLRKDPNQQYQVLFQRAKSARRPYDKEAWLNVAFYLGRQYSEWHGPSSTIREIALPENTKRPNRPVANKIMHFVNQELSSVLQTKPTADVLPATDDPIDASVANVAKAYLDWLLSPQVNDFDMVLTEAVMWALAGTEAYLKWTWCKDEWDTKAVGTHGRGQVVAVSPFDVYPDPYVRAFRDARYVFHSNFQDVEQVFNTYGVEIPPTGVEKADPGKTTMMREMGFAPILEGATVTELWYKPCRRYPHGLFTVWAGNTTLVPPGPFPYQHGHLPFTQLGSVLIPGNQHFTSAVSFLRAPQMELNKFHAQMIAVREAFSNPKWGIDSNLELEELPDDSPNQVLVYNTNNGQIPAPIIIQPSGMPNNDQGQFIANEMMDVVGQHEVSQGQVPGRVEAAQAIQLLKEDDDGRLAQLLTTIEAATAEGGWQQLQLAKQFLKAEQIVQVYSPDGLMEARRFVSTQINPGMRVNVQMGTGLSRSRAARVDQLNTLWGNGIIRDPDLMARLLDMPISAINPAKSFDVRAARNENMVMGGGKPVSPNTWDDHDTHRIEHDNYRKTSEFMMLPSETKAYFEMHQDMHNKMQVKSLGEQLQRQQLAAAVAQGAGFAPPGAPGQPAAPVNPNVPPTPNGPPPGPGATGADVSN